MAEVTETKVDDYPGLRKAALEIAYDNGMINCQQTEQCYLQSLNPWLEAAYPPDLAQWDAWLSTRSDEALHILTCGEQTEMQWLMAHAPVSNRSSKETLDRLLNQFFQGDTD